MASLYFDCTSGISGDMIVAALLDAGADKDALQTALDSIPADGFKTQITRVTKNGIAACDFDVILENENHDHDMIFLFGENLESEKSMLGFHIITSIPMNTANIFMRAMKIIHTKFITDIHIITGIGASPKFSKSSNRQK